MKALLSLLSSAIALGFATHTASAVDWNTTGNSGTNPAANFLGTKDNQPLEFRVNNKRVWRAEPSDFNDSVNIVAGAPSNSVGNGLRGVTIAGGGYSTHSNDVDAHFATISGGSGHWIEAGGHASVIAGGSNNLIGASDRATIGGGTDNTIEGSSNSSVIAGGGYNRIGANSYAAVIAGGSINRISADSSHAFIAGGYENRAKAPYSFAAGSEAIAAHAGSFVWADRRLNPVYIEPYSSEGPNEFRIRARGGVHLSNGTSLNFGNQARQMINLWNKDYGIGVQTSTLYQRTAHTFAWYQGGVHNDNFVNPGSGKTLMLLNAWGLTVNGTLVSKSDRDAKENFAPVDAADVLAKVVALPISRWSYKDDERKSLHVGPMAQDFHAAFHLGEDDKHIATVDADGVALAAIQALHAKIVQLEREAQLNRERIARLESKPADRSR